MIALLVHTHSMNEDEFEAALGLPPADVIRINSTGSQFSAGYDSRVGVAAAFPTLPQVLAKFAPHLNQHEKVVLVGFSAGCWAIRAWLRSSMDQVTAAVFLDGLHAGGDDMTATLGPEHEAVIDFARICMTDPGRALVITHSQIRPPGYASTRMTADAILAKLGLSRMDRRTNVHAGDLHVVADLPDIEGEDKADGPAHVAQQGKVGPEVCRLYVRPLIDGSRDTARPEQAWRDRILSLGERCVLLCEEEMAREPTPSNATLAKYLHGCERSGSPGLGAWLAREAAGGKRHNHCAATQSWAAFQCRTESETVPHAYRAGAKELMRDAIAAGAWLPIENVRAGKAFPGPGDLAIYWRVQPDGWQGHVDRVRTIAGDGYGNIGANEGLRGAWKTEFTPWTKENLLGFVLYPRGATVARHPLDDATRRDVLALVNETIAGAIADAPWETVA